ncbi:hypothetical protein RUMTOR_01321 [[Ruminococcus] torques ATCC 27756]|uniref:Uncharacterized protein n=1 Tax=[Ruminococcus] torques ATCC 27756 TaxID=411460 RepID=A5KM57_9FIRM|nr:hypothetical protein RUMTOR_01321 [[Ruminococcus] torques ATCC 27756]
MDGIIKHKKTRNLRFNKVSRLSSAMRKKRLELSQDKLPLEPESSASAIPPLPLDK